MPDDPALVHAFIVEDEPLGRRRLRDLAAGVPWLAVVGEAATGRAAVAAIDELQPDLVFLDVELPDISGLDVLRRATHRAAIIFATAFDAFAIAAFELGAIDYLLKPFGRERFGRAVERARPFLEAQAGLPAAARAADVSGRGRVRRLYVRDGSTIVPLAAAAIERIEACDDFVIVHAGRRAFRLNVAMATIETRLDPRAFVRVHRSHLVNLDHVTAITPYDGSRFEITMRSGARLVSSRQKSRDLRHLGR
jgi:two-component system, LytTR family, response regulator